MNHDVCTVSVACKVSKDLLQYLDRAGFQFVELGEYGNASHYAEPAERSGWVLLEHDNNAGLF